MGNALEATKRERRREEIKEEVPPESFELPPEIIREILIRLPAKSIGRFRSVSKLFYSLSSDQRFAKSHLDLTIRNDSHRKLIVSSHNLHTLDLDSIADGCDRIRDLVPVELNYPLKDNPSIFNKMVKRYVKDHLYLGRSVMDEDYCRVMNFTATSYQRNWVEIIGSSHGLVCISPNAVPIFLYNPTTGESKRLPESIPPKSKEYGEDLQTNGFGFDDLTDDYKVVKLTADSDEGLTASLYSLKSDSWRWIRDLNYEDNNGFISGVNLNGAIHWVFTLHEGNNNNQRVVVAFDLKTDEFREMSLPDEVEDCQHRFKNFVVGNLNGRLCLVNSCYEVHDDIWVMNEYGVASSWSRIWISFLYRSMKPLCSIKNNEEVLLELDGDMVLCNFETGASRNVGIRGVNLSGGFEADTYVESLVSPNSYGLEN